MDILGDDDDDRTVPQGGHEGLRINSEFAQNYKERKKAQELRHLRAQYGDDFDEDEEAVEEDEEADMFTEEKKQAFANTLWALKNGSADIKDPSKTWWGKEEEEDEEEGNQDKEANNKAKKVTLKTQLTDAILGIASDQPQKKNPSANHVNSAEDSKGRFLKAAAGVVDDSDDEDGTGGFGFRQVGTIASTAPKPAAPPQTKPTGAVVNRKANDVFNVTPEDTPEMQFVKAYFRDEGWKENTKMKVGSKVKQAVANPVVPEHDAPEDDNNDSDDKEEFFDKAEDFEQKYQEGVQRKMFKHEDGEFAETIQQFPRDAGEYRQKQGTRKEERERRKERAHEAEVAYEENIKRLKKLKKDEIQKRIQVIEKIAGVGPQKSSHKQKTTTKPKKGGFDEKTAALLDQFLTNDFDDADWDAKMAQLFDDKYYNDEEDDEDIENEMDGEDVDYMAPELPSKMKGGKGNANDSWLSEACDEAGLLYPTEQQQQIDEDGEAEKVAKKSSKQSSKLHEELNQLKHDVNVYHGFEDEEEAIGGADKARLKTRFRYTTVPEDDIALDPVDVLTMDDRTLNDIAPLRFYAPYVTPQERRKFKYKTINKLKEMREADRRGGHVNPYLMQNPEAPFKASKKYRTDSRMFVEGNPEFQQKEKEGGNDAQKPTSDREEQEPVEFREEEQPRRQNNNYNNNNYNSSGAQRQKHRGKRLRK